MVRMFADPRRPRHCCKALKAALRPKLVTARRRRPPKYGSKVVAALVFCWATLGMPTGKRLAPMLSELVAILHRFGELDVDDDTATLLAGMSAATIDRRLAGERKKHELKGRSRTKPGSLLKSQIPVRTWADWDDAVPGFVEIDLVAHDGGNAAGEHAWTLTVTDIATGWTENRSVRNKARKWVLAALDDIARVMPFPILGVDSDNGKIRRQQFCRCSVFRLLALCRRNVGFVTNMPNSLARLRLRAPTIVIGDVGAAGFALISVSLGLAAGLALTERMSVAAEIRE